MARVLLINPNKWGRGITAIWIPSHTSCLRAAGHTVELFDATFFSKWTSDEISFNTQNKQYKPSDYQSFVKYSDADIYQELQKKVDEFKPDFIFWSAISSHIHGEGEYVNIQYGYDLVKELKTQAIFVTAGLQATAVPQKVCKSFPRAQYFFRGESELVLTDLVSAFPDKAKMEKVEGLVINHDGHAVLTGKQPIIHNMDLIPPYDYSIFDPQVLFRPYQGKVVKGVDYEMSRGCIFTCSYCVETVLQDYYEVTKASPTSGALSQPQKYLRAKSPARVFEELTTLNKKMGVELIRCQDTNFLTINRPLLKGLAELLENSDLAIKLYVETRVDRVTDADIPLLKKLKVDGVGTGVEVSSAQFRESHLNRFASQSRLIENFKKLKDAGINVTAYNIIGLPSETEEMILETIQLNRLLNPSNITVAFYSPYIGTLEAKRGADESAFDDYEYDVDGQLRTVTKSSLVSSETLSFYKRHFVDLVRNGTENLRELKMNFGIS